MSVIEASKIPDIAFIAFDLQISHEFDGGTIARIGGDHGGNFDEFIDYKTLRWLSILDQRHFVILFVFFLLSSLLFIFFSKPSLSLPSTI